jgi:hypothetical protein
MSEPAPTHTAASVARSADQVSATLVEARTLLLRLDEQINALAAAVDTWPHGFVYAHGLYDASDALRGLLGRVPDVARAIDRLRDAS